MGLLTCVKAPCKAAMASCPPTVAEIHVRWQWNLEGHTARKSSKEDSLCAKAKTIWRVPSAGDIAARQNNERKGIIVWKVRHQHDTHAGIHSNRLAIGSMVVTSSSAVRKLHSRRLLPSVHGFHSQELLHQYVSKITLSPRMM